MEKPNVQVETPVDYPVVDSVVVLLTEWLNDYCQASDIRQQFQSAAPVWSHEAMNLLRLLESLISDRASHAHAPPENKVIVDQRGVRPHHGINIWRRDFQFIAGAQAAAQQQRDKKHHWKSSLFGQSAFVQG